MSNMSNLTTGPVHVVQFVYASFNHDELIVNIVADSQSVIRHARLIDVPIETTCFDMMRDRAYHHQQQHHVTDTLYRLSRHMPEVH